MERPWSTSDRGQATRCCAAPALVPLGPLPGPSGELSTLSPLGTHSLALWRSSSLDAGLWVIVGPRGDGGRQHHRRLAGEGAGRSDQEPRPFGGHGAHQWTTRSRAAAPVLPEGGRRLTHPQTLLPPPSSLPSSRHTRPPHHQPCHAACTCLLPCPWPCSQLPAPPVPHFAADPARCPRNRTPGGRRAHFARPGIMQLKISPGQTGGRPNGTLPSWPQPGPPLPRSSPACSWCLLMTARS